MTLRKAAEGCGRLPPALFYCGGGFGNEKHSEGCECSMGAEITAPSMKDTRDPRRLGRCRSGSSGRMGAGISRHLESAASPVSFSVVR